MNKKLKKFQIDYTGLILRISIMSFFIMLNGTVHSQYISKSMIGLKGPVKEITETTFRVNSFTNEKNHMNTRIIHFNKNGETLSVSDSIFNTATTYFHKDGKVVSAEIRNDSVTREKYNWIDDSTYQIINESNEIRAVVKLDSVGRIIQWDEPWGWKEEYIYDGLWIVTRKWYSADAEEPTTLNSRYNNFKVDEYGNIVSYESNMLVINMHIFHAIKYYEQ
ncbi:hypothetical protein [Fulvivirga sedimenti]|uniref:Uncharacterized protein n=1 Tax=Fulvivirga sedimenti TaxID=2879465 RepID=A0A9X1HWQ8_9BACT|nr:hypothetical protein [Fulvivirga sedimenti]MCA6075589.1 hypothetical protein [Fulvivirga sedimenti]MCA6076766.1 hypothetical protein [Fulvivirga sedimenti]MCA6077894.1 hypothetical protein [Fulvivirga sedimenti]